MKLGEDQRRSYPVGASRGEESPLVGYAACSRVMCTYMIRRRNCNHVTGVNAIVVSHSAVPRASSLPTDESGGFERWCLLIRV